MAETSFPVAGGAGVNEYTYELLMAQTLGNGRVEMYGEGAVTVAPLVYADSTGRSVKVAALCAYIIRGYRWESGPDVLSVPLTANTSGQPRIDRIVLRLDRATFQVRLAVLTGTAASTPAVPALTQTLTSTGYFEVPLARITVKSQAGTDLPSIAAADVQAEHRYLAPPGQYGISTMRGTNQWLGRHYLEYDTGRVFMGAVGGDILIAENGPRTKIAAAGGWNLDNIYAQRVNGATHLQGYASMTAADKAPSTDLVLCTLPADFRPQFDRWLQATMSPGQAAFAYAESATGVVRITAYPSTFPTGGKVVIGPISWPSTGVKA